MRRQVAGRFLAGSEYPEWSLDRFNWDVIPIRDTVLMNFVIPKRDTVLMPKSDSKATPPHMGEDSGF